MSEVHLPLGALLGENMARSLLLDHDLASSGDLVALCSTLSCFHLRHLCALLSRRQEQEPWKLRYVIPIRE